MTAPKTKLKKTRVTKAQKELAYRYKCAYNFLFEKLPPWKKTVVVEQPDNKDERIVDEFIKEVRRLAESNREIPDMKND